MALSFLESKKDIEFPLIEKKNRTETKKIKSRMRTESKRIKKAEEIGLPENEGDEIRFITTSGINVISYLLYISDLFGVIDEVVLSYYVISQDALTIINRLLKDGKIKKLFIQTSTLRLAARDIKMIEQIKMMRKNNSNVDANFCVSHCKIMCINISGKYYVLEGSGNLSGNARIEQYVFCRSKDIYNFHSEWIMNVHKYSSGTKRLDEI